MLRPAAFVRAGGQASQQQHSDLEFSSTRDWDLIWLWGLARDGGSSLRWDCKGLGAKVALQISLISPLVCACCLSTLPTEPALFAPRRAASEGGAAGAFQSIE